MLIIISQRVNRLSSKSVRQNNIFKRHLNILILTEWYCSCLVGGGSSAALITRACNEAECAL